MANSLTTPQGHGMGWNPPEEFELRKLVIQYAQAYNTAFNEVDPHNLEKHPDGKGIKRVIDRSREIEEEAMAAILAHTAKAVTPQQSVQIEDRILDVRDVQMIVDAYRRDLLRELGDLVKKLQTDLDSPPEVFSRRGGLIDAMTLVERPWDKRHVAPVLVNTVPMTSYKSNNSAPSPAQENE